MYLVLIYISDLWDDIQRHLQMNLAVERTTFLASFGTARNRTKQEIQLLNRDRTETDKIIYKTNISENIFPPGSLP